MGPRATDTSGILLASLVPGTWVGAYEIERRLATRGIGHTYAARDAGHGHRVMLTVLPSAQMRPPSLLGEHEPIELLDHPGIPRMLDSGVLPDRRPWVATELVEGRTLDTVLSAAPSDVAAWIRDLAEVLDHAHVRGVVHRHLMPHLIVLPDTGQPFATCVIDWTGASAAMPLAAMPYVAPEQQRGDIVDDLVDVYALGAIARELVRRSARGSTPPVLTAIIDRMVARDALDRPSAFEVREYAGWVVDQLAGAVPKEIDHERTEPLPPLQHPITSEMSPSISGEIWRRR